MQILLPFIGGFGYSLEPQQRSSLHMTPVVAEQQTLLLSNVIRRQKEVGTGGSHILGLLFTNPNPANKNKMKTIMPCPLASDEMRRGSLLFLVHFSPWLGHI